MKISPLELFSCGVLFNYTFVTRGYAEFPIDSSSSSTLKELVCVSEEPKEYEAKQNEEIFLRLPQ
jgi:hypothetical protein